MLHRHILILLLCIGFLPQEVSRAQSNPAIDYIPSSAFLAIQARPQAALADPSMELMPRELIRVFGEKELGLNLLELEQVTLLIETPRDAELREPPGVGIYARFASPQRPGGNLAGQLQPGSFEGRDGFVLAGELQIVELDPQTWLAGTPDFLKRMLNARGASSALIERLKEVGDDTEVAALLNVEPVRQLIVANLPPRDQVPPPFVGFLEVPSMLNFVEYRGSIKNQTEQFRLDAVDADAAQEFVRLLGRGVEMAKTMALSGMINEMGGVDPEYQRAMLDYAERLSDWIQAAIQPDVDGSKIVFSGQKTGGPLGGIAVTGVLTGLLLPAVQSAREAARRVESLNRMRQMAIAIHNYHDVYNRFPSQASVDDDGQPLLSWRVHLLPYMEEQALYDQFHLDEPWDSPHNIQLLDKMPEIYQNVSLPGMTSETVFLGVAGPHSAFDVGKQLSFRDFLDGTSNTVMLVEVNPEMAVPWTQPADWDFDPDNPLRGLGGLRPGGFNVTFTDASSRLISSLIDEQVWKALCTRDGGEVVDYRQIEQP